MERSARPMEGVDSEMRFAARPKARTNDCVGRRDVETHPNDSYYALGLDTRTNDLSTSNETRAH